MSFWYKSFIAVLFFAFLSGHVSAQNNDIELLRSINVARNTSWDGTMKIISNTEGVLSVSVPIMVSVAAYLQSDKKLLQKAINIGISLAATSASTYILKRGVNRNRPSYTYPDIQAQENEKYHSFPSGHTSNAFCTATSVSLNFPKLYVIVPAFTWAAFVGYSRLHLGVHYPSDVAAGAVLGAATAYATFVVNKKLKKYFEKKYLKDKKIETF